MRNDIQDGRDREKRVQTLERCIAVKDAQLDGIRNQLNAISEKLGVTQR